MTESVIRAILGKVADGSDGVTAESLGPLHGSLAGLTLKPTTYGGSAKPAAEFVAEVCELAALDGSLGWLAAAFNTAAYAIATLPAADTVWASDPHALITIATNGGATIRRNHLTGRWPLVVGAEYADWFLLSVSRDRRVLMPRSVVQAERIEHRSGLAAAGICDVAVSGSAVDISDAFADDHAAVIVAAGAAAAVVGTADGVWRRHVGQVRARLATSYGGDDVTNAASAQVAWAMSDIDAAKLQVNRFFDGPSATRACRQAVTRARGAADRLLGNSKHALDDSDPVTRQWQDVQFGCRLAERIFEQL